MTTRTRRRSALACSTATAVLAALAMPVAAHAQAATYSFNIPAQDLSAALRTFGRQARQQIAFDGAAVRGKTSAAVTGVMNPDEALRQMLAGTGLQAGRVSGGVLVVRGGQAGPPGEAAGAPAAEPAQVSEVTVTGTNIRGIRDLPAPVKQFTRETIDQGGFATLGEVFSSLPENVPDITPASANSGAQGMSRLAGANTEESTSIDLYGLGSQSTLTLVNGHRRPATAQGRIVDTSTIPLALVERIDVVTGGKSAIYGSDAVAGVVNILTRHDFDGAESDVTVGGPTSGAGAQRFKLDLMLGRTGDNGGFVVAYDYSHDRRLDSTRAGIVGPPSPDFGFVPIPGQFDLQPDHLLHSGYLAGHFSLGESTEVVGDALYAHSRTIVDGSFTGPGFSSLSTSTNRQEVFSATLGTHTTLSRHLSLDFSADFGRTRDVTTLTTDTKANSSTTTYGDQSFGAILNSDFLLATVPIRVAAGADYRREHLNNSNGAPKRTVSSGFGEVFVPMVEGGEYRGLRRLELSAAIRYSRYSDFGSTTKPQAGVLWSPVDGLNIRGTYATAFRAPDLFSLAQTTYAILVPIPDPSSPKGRSLMLTTIGGNAKLKPEIAKTWTIGFDWTPPFEPEAKLSASYYDVAYTNRIDDPTGSGSFFRALQQGCPCSSVINRHPTSAQVAAILASLHAGNFFNYTGTPFNPATQDALALFPDLATFNDQTNNISTQRSRGITFSATDVRESSWGRLNFGISGNYYLALNRTLLPGAPTTPDFGEVGRPARYRLRANLGLIHGPFQGFLFVNYVSAYRDVGVTPPIRVSSWTTTDATIGVDLAKIIPGVGEQTRLALSVTNLFDARPPAIASNEFGITFDPANASALGRYVSVSLRTRW